MNLAALGEKNRGVDTEEVLAMWKLLPTFPSESDVRRVLERYQATHLGTEYTHILYRMAVYLLSWCWSCPFLDCVATI